MPPVHISTVITAWNKDSAECPKVEGYALRGVVTRYFEVNREIHYAGEIYPYHNDKFVYGRLKVRSIATVRNEYSDLKKFLEFLEERFAVRVKMQPFKNYLKVAKARGELLAA